MRAIALAVVLLVSGLATAVAQAQGLVVLPKPSFPAPARDVSAPAGPRLELVSSRYVSPEKPLPAPRTPPAFVPKQYRGEESRFAIMTTPRWFVVYGGRYLVRYSGGAAIDFVNYLRPPNGAWLEEIRWAREVGGVLYVEHAHLTYASATHSRNAYITAIELRTNRVLWRSPALVANARTFVVAGDLIVAGYGFTAEPDFLYLLDRRTGRVLHRLPVPSAPEVIKLRGNRLEVRTYDRQVVAKIVR